MPAGLADTYIAYKFIKMLALPFKKTDAYKLGIIDDDGTRIRTKEADDAARNAGLKYTNLHRIVFNMKRLLAKIPLGRTKIAGFAAALWFLKEEARRLGVKDDTLVERAFLDYTKSKGIGFDTLNESFQCSETIEPGTYVLNNEKTIIVEEALTPIGNIFGIPVFRQGDAVFSEEDIK